MPLRFDFVLYGSVAENACVIATIGISIIIIRIAFAGDVAWEILQINLHCAPGARAKVQT